MAPLSPQGSSFREGRCSASQGRPAGDLTAAQCHWREHEASSVEFEKEARNGHFLQNKVCLTLDPLSHNRNH